MRLFSAEVYKNSIKESKLIFDDFLPEKDTIKSVFDSALKTSFPTA